MKHCVFLFLLAVLATFSVSCKKDSKDLTTKITGGFIGELGSNVHGDFSNYEIVVTKISNEKISIKPKIGTEFEAFETEIQEFGEGTIGSAPGSGQTQETVVIFTSSSSPVTLSIQRNLTDDSYVFVGEKQ